MIAGLETVQLSYIIVQYLEHELIDSRDKTRENRLLIANIECYLAQITIRHAKILY